MRSSHRNAIVVAGGILASLLVLFLVLLFLGLQSPPGYEVDLEVWGPVVDSDVFMSANQEYYSAHPFVRSVTYKKFLYDEYKKDLIDALASGNGPDVFFIRNTWIPEFQDKIVPAPAILMDQATVEQQFVDVVASDVILDGQVYGAPLSVDSLALYYNKDIFNFSGISSPPSTWEELVSLVPKLTEVDSGGWITQSAVSLGTARNINRFSDVLNLLFLQQDTGLEFTTRSPNVNQIDLGAKGEKAMEFFMSFSDINSANYTWNLRHDYSIDAFHEGNLAMMLNYSWHYDTIKRKNNRLNFGVAPLPQWQGKDPVNFANYWVMVVSKNKLTEGENMTAEQSNAVRTFEGWQYIRYITLHRGGSFLLTNGLTGTQKEFTFPEDPAKVYLEKTQSPAARRDLLEAQKTDPILGPFASGNLIARSWRLMDFDLVETQMAEVVDATHSGKLTIKESIRLLEERMRNLLRR